MAFGGVEVVRLDGEWRSQQHGRAFCLGVGWTGTHPAENRVATRIRVATRFRVMVPGCGPLDAEDASVGCMQLGFVVRSTLVDVLCHCCASEKLRLTACWQATSAGEPDARKALLGPL